MNTIIFFIENGQNWSPYKWAIQANGILGSDGQIVVESVNGWISILRHEKIIQDYDDAEKEIVLDFINNPVPFLIEWRGNELIEQLIANVPIDCNVVVDNDHGLICPLAEIKGLPVNSWVRSSLSVHPPT